MQFDQMQFRAIAFVLAEAILRKTRAEVAHNRVARDLGDHARRRDTETVTITIDDGRLRKGKGKNRQAIDQNVIGPKAKGLERDPHRLVRGAQDVNRVDLHRIDDSDRPGDRGVRDEVMVNFFALFGEKLFRIV